MTHPSWQPWQPWQERGVPQSWSGPSAPSMLASHADRERAVDVLRAGYAEGRLEQTEFEKRVGRAYAARTVGELALLVADLPQGPMPLPAPVTPVPRAFLAVPRPQTNGKAVGSAVCGVLCLFSFGLTGIPAVVLGHAARTEIRRTGEGGDALALAGLVLGWLSTAAWAALLALMVVAAAVSA
ncbi:DUF1707 and DUF4190 domain-containing protein [Streptomyces curacoi]|uniref:Uncharacterized protein n=1 Tax=Streptomyces curacoi TaxID=146536 RepID=A0A117P6N0_9ACTN|nr:DUF1707 and DUF4190 domain-containing protein [Streptomyces curacoi]KUM74077.1 hypothetical protein AQI70_19220 [Streptomyces curacoi]